MFEAVFPPFCFSFISSSKGSYQQTPHSYEKMVPRSSDFEKILSARCDFVEWDQIDIIWDNQSYRRKNRKDETISMISIEFIECRNSICFVYSTVYIIIGVDPQMTLKQARLSNAQETQLWTLKWTWLFPECISVLSFPSFSVGFTRWRMQGMNRYIKRQREAVFIGFHCDWLIYKLIAGLNFRHDICIVLPTIELCAKGCFVSAHIESMNQA